MQQKNPCALLPQSDPDRYWVRRTGACEGDAKPNLTDSTGEPPEGARSPRLQDGCRPYALLRGREITPARMRPGAPASDAPPGAPSAVAASSLVLRSQGPIGGAAVGDAPPLLGSRSVARCGAHLLITERAERHGGMVTPASANAAASSCVTTSTSGNMCATVPTNTSGTASSSARYAAVGHAMRKCDRNEHSTTMSAPAQSSAPCAAGGRVRRGCARVGCATRSGVALRGGVHRARGHAGVGNVRNMLRRTVSTVQPRAAAHPHEQELVVKVLEAVLTTTDRLPHRDSVADGGEGASELHNVQRPVCVGLPRVEENVVLELHTLDRVWKVPNVRRGDDVVCAATARTKCRKCAVAGVASRASVTRTLRCVAKQRCALRRRGPVLRRA